MRALVSRKHSLITKLLAALVVAVALLATPLGTSHAYAKSLKASGAKFTTVGKVNKTKIWYAGAGLQNCTCSIKSIKVKNAKKAGYKTATVVFEVKEKWNPNNRQIMKMTNYLDSDGSLDEGDNWAFIVDGKTGRNLEVESVAAKYDVTLRTNGWRFSNYWKHTATDGSWVELPKTARIKYTITYPKNYNNLCVGIGVGQKRYSYSAMSKFEDGRVSYTKSWWAKNNKRSTFFVKVK